MIISKKKFERMVEEEVHKRMNAADEKRWQEERYDKLQNEVRCLDTQVQCLRAEFDKLLHTVQRHEYHFSRRI